MNDDDVRASLALAADAVRPGPAPPGRQLRERADSRGSGRRRWLVVAAAAATALVIGGAWMVTESGGSEVPAPAGTSQRVMNPSLIGLTTERAKAELSGACQLFCVSRLVTGRG